LAAGGGNGRRAPLMTDGGTAHDFANSINPGGVPRRRVCDADAGKAGTPDRQQRDPHSTCGLWPMSEDQIPNCGVG